MQKKMQHTPPLSSPLPLFLSWLSTKCEGQKRLFYCGKSLCNSWVISRGIVNNALHLVRNKTEKAFRSMINYCRELGVWDTGFSRQKKICIRNHFTLLFCLFNCERNTQVQQTFSLNKSSSFFFFFFKDANL